MKFPVMPSEGDSILAWAREVQNFLHQIKPARGKLPRREPPVLVPWNAIVTGVEVTESAEPTATGLKVKVNPLSTLLASERYDDVAEITGMDTEWTLDAEKLLVLKANFASDGSLDTADLLCDTKDAMGWAESKSYELTSPGDPEDQSGVWWQLLAYLRPAREPERAIITLDGDALVLINTVATHLQVQRRCSEDAERYRIRWLAPASAGYVAE